MSAANVVLLGTGSPRPCLDRSQPAQLIELGGQSFIIDCGEGVTGQLVHAGRDVAAVQKIFLTHLHWDHILGYAGLVWSGWSAGRPSLEVWGPPGTKRMHEILFGMLYRDDVDWSSGIGYARSGIDSITIHEVGEGLVYERDGIAVTAAAVKHTITTYAYRFEYAGKRIVFSGDTAACDELVKCAEGADLLIQDACAIPSRLYADDRSRSPRGSDRISRIPGTGRSDGTGGRGQAPRVHAPVARRRRRSGARGGGVQFRGRNDRGMRSHGTPRLGNGRGEARTCRGLRGC